LEHVEILETLDRAEIATLQRLDVFVRKVFAFEKSEQLSARRCISVYWAYSE